MYFRPHRQQAFAVTNRRVIVGHRTKDSIVIPGENIADLRAIRAGAGRTSGGIIAAAVAGAAVAAMNASAAKQEKTSRAYWSRAIAVVLVDPHGQELRLDLPGGHASNLGLTIAQCLFAGGGETLPVVPFKQDRPGHGDAKGRSAFPIIGAVFFFLLALGCAGMTVQFHRSLDSFENGRLSRGEYGSFGRNLASRAAEVRRSRRNMFGAATAGFGGLGVLLFFVAARRRKPTTLAAGARPAAGTGTTPAPPASQFQPAPPASQFQPAPIPQPAAPSPIESPARVPVQSGERPIGQALSNPHYYLSVNGASHGPYSTEQVAAWLAAGQIEGAHVCLEGQQQWIPVRMHPAFAAGTQHRQHSA